MNKQENVLNKDKYDCMSTYKIKVLNYDTIRREYEIAIYALRKCGRVDAIRKTKTRNFYTFARRNNIRIIQLSPNYTKK